MRPPKASKPDDSQEELPTPPVFLSTNWASPNGDFIDAELASGEETVHIKVSRTSMLLPIKVVATLIVALQSMLDAAERAG